MLGRRADISPELLDVAILGTPQYSGYSFRREGDGTQMIYRALCYFFEIEPSWQPSLPAASIRARLTVSSGEDE